MGPDRGATAPHPPPAAPHESSQTTDDWLETRDKASKARLGHQTFRAQGFGGGREVELEQKVARARGARQTRPTRQARTPTHVPYRTGTGTAAARAPAPTQPETQEPDTRNPRAPGPTPPRATRARTQTCICRRSQREGEGKMSWQKLRTARPTARTQVQIIQ